ncbi:GNAT family N-acetyltransferase [bacterium]|nr:GNAT family N-acetyltransferase [bacterium]
MKNIQSLGYRTDFFFSAFDGKIEDKGEYWRVESYFNPDFFWGNLLLFKAPPKAGDETSWKDLFKKEFRSPERHHCTLAWDTPDGTVGITEGFEASGFELEKSVVLTCESVELPPKFNSDIEIRPLDDHELEAAIQIQIDSGDEHLSRESWEDFYRKQMGLYKKLMAIDAGIWVGAFINGELTGSLGIFAYGDVARYQIVSTAPKFRRQGICSSLVYTTALTTLANPDIKQLIMVADADYHAAKIYESCGFKPTQTQHGLCWWDKNVHT